LPATIDPSKRSKPIHNVKDHCCFCKKQQNFLLDIPQAPGGCIRNLGSRKPCAAAGRPLDFSAIGRNQNEVLVEPVGIEPTT
jgi:hypothetical protein